VDLSAHGRKPGPLTDTDRPAWVLWQIRALWRHLLDVERRLVDLIRRVEQLERDAPTTDDAQEG
jgi:hypothetical protein